MIPHFALPFRFETQTTGVVTAAVNEQDSEDEIDTCVEIIVRMPQGSRIEAPDFGNPSQEFNQGGIAEEVLRTAISDWEPRAEALVAQDPDRYDELITNVGLTLGIGQISASEAGGND